MTERLGHGRGWRARCTDRGRHLRLGRHPDALARGRPHRRVVRVRQRVRPPARCQPRRAPVRRGDRALAGPAPQRGQHRRRAPGPDASRLRDRPAQCPPPGGPGRAPPFLGPAHRRRPRRRAASGGPARARIRIGVLSNTLWPRTHHEAVFARDGLLELIDGAVYSSELPVGKPHEDAFVAALRAVGVDDPARAVFVGDRRVGRRARCPAGRDARDPRPAQRHPPRPARPRRGGA